MLTTTTQRCWCGGVCTPGSRPDQVDVPAVWFMVKLQYFFSLCFGPAIPLLRTHCFQMVLIAHLPSVPSCYVVSSVGRELLLTSIFPGYNQMCLKLYWCLVDSGPFLTLCCSSAPQKSLMRLKRRFAILPNLPSPGFHRSLEQASSSSPGSAPTTHPGSWVSWRGFPHFPALLYKLAGAAQSLGANVWSLCVAADTGRHVLSAHEDYSSNSYFWYSQAKGPRCPTAGRGAEGSQPPKMLLTPQI